MTISTSDKNKKLRIALGKRQMFKAELIASLKGKSKVAINKGRP